MKTVTKFIYPALAVLAVACFELAPTARGEGGSVTVLNGSARRPFYIFGHNPNTLEEAEAALQAGANALEPDVQLFDCLGNHDVLIVYHDNPCTFPQGTTRPVLTLDAYLDGLHNLAINYPQLALVVFDVKTPAASAAHGTQIINSIRNHLNYGPVSLNVIISVATRSDGAIFDNILGWSLGANEGVQIDAEDDAADIVNFFCHPPRNYCENIGYGDGTAGQGPNLPRALDKAAFLRASVGYPKAVTYVYTLGNESSMHSFIDGGVDGIIPDGFPPPLVLDPSFITELVGVVNAHPEIRVATRDDNPFLPLNEAYGLEIRTTDDMGAGTDADLTFTLNGCRGSATVTVNSGNINPLYDTHRMERGQTDWVTIPSLNLGKLTSITIHNGGGIDFPNWHLQDIRVSSATWMSPDFDRAYEYTVTYNGEVEGDATVTLPLTPNFTEPLPTIQCPAPITVSNMPGQCNAAVTFSFTVSGLCPDLTAVSSASSGSTFPIGTTTVSAHAESASGPPSPPCTFTVTVNDTENPVITCPPNMTVPNDPGLCSAIVDPGTATATDNCPGVTVMGTRNDGQPLNAPYPVGTTTIIWKATDAATNMATCSQTITVNDTENPVITCPPDRTVPNDPGLCSAIVDPGMATATDNCPGVTVMGARNDGQPLNAPYPVGTTTITWKATDAAQNMATCLQTITVNDVEPPVITASVAANCLWPPDHDFMDVGLSLAVSDNCTPAAQIGVDVKVTSDERPEEPTGDGNFSPDAVVTGTGVDRTVKVRRERVGSRDGRVYSIRITATDQYNNSSLKVLRVDVPKNQNPRAQCAIDSRPVPGADAPDGGFFATSPPAPIIGNRN